jgi:hypothetical protein
VGQVDVLLYDSGNRVASRTQSAADGTFTLSSSSGSTSGYHLVCLVSDGSAIGSGVYASTGSSIGYRTFGGGTALSTPALGSSTPLSTITMPVGVALSGAITVGGTATGCIPLQFTANSSNKVVTVRTRSDGSYLLCLPAGASVNAVNGSVAAQNDKTLAGFSVSSAPATTQTKNISW